MRVKPFSWLYPVAAAYLIFVAVIFGFRNKAKAQEQKIMIMRIKE